jgi:hypothetical protein
MVTVYWMSEFFFDHADISPNDSLVSNLDYCDKKDIYEIYRNEMKVRHNNLSEPKKNSKESNECVSLDTFYDIWNNIFYWVKLRVYKAVSGKCWTCFQINDIRKKCTDHETLQAAKRLHQLHRGGLFMLERKSYKRRSQKAQKSENYNKVLSIIIDGMDQNHCRIPLLQQATFPEPITQHLTGVLMHRSGSKNSE